VNSSLRSLLSAGAPLRLGSAQASGAMLSDGTRYLHPASMRGQEPKDFALFKHALAERGIHARYSLDSRRANRIGITVGAPSGAMRLDVIRDPVVLEHAPSSRGIPAGFSLASRRASDSEFTVGAPSGAMRLDVIRDPVVLEHAPSSRGIHAALSLASRRASHFSLRGQREVTKRKATPIQRSPGILPCDCAQRLRGCLTVHH
jgi:hypothetical protein